MAFDFGVLQRLPPDQRVSALQRLREQLGKAIEQRRKEMEVGQKEVLAAEQLLERAEQELAVLLKVETPGQKVAALDDLFFVKGKKAERPDQRMPLETELEDVEVQRREREVEELRRRETLEETSKPYRAPGAADDEQKPYVQPGDAPKAYHGKDERRSPHAYVAVAPDDEKMK